MPKSPRYGRLLGDFVVGETYQHPFEVTLDEGMDALWSASFLDPTPMYSSRAEAKRWGLPDRPLPPLLMLNLALSFSVHDVSEQAIAHLAYVDVRFPAAAYAGQTVSARSTVLNVKPTASGDRGVVQVRTVLQNDDGQTVCAFERKALIRAGKSDPTEQLPTAPSAPVEAPPPFDAALTHPRLMIPPRKFDSGLPGWLEDFSVGQVVLHRVGKTVGESEHMQLTALVRNTHPLHFDEVYCRTSSFQKTRVVYGGLVLGFCCALASRDVGSHAAWELRMENGAHPNPVLAGDTIYAASHVLAVEPSSESINLGEVTLRLVGVKNTTAEDAFAAHGEALFAEELKKSSDSKIKDKVVEITRTLLVPSRGRS